MTKKGHDLTKTNKITKKNKDKGVSFNTKKNKATDNKDHRGKRKAKM